MKSISERATKEQLLADPWHRKIILLLEEKFGRPLTENEVKFISDTAFWADLIPKKALNWTGLLWECTERLIAHQASKSDRHLFWVRLYGFFDELLPYFQTEVRAELDSVGFEIGKMICSMKNLFSEEELVFLDYYRNNVVHVFQSSDRIRFHKNKADITDTYTDHLTGKKRTVQERGLIIQGVQQTFANQQLLDEYFANKIHKALEKILFHCHQWSNAPENHSSIE